MKTSGWFKYFGEGWVGISRSNPRGVAGGYRTYRRLAPGPWFNSVDADTYDRLYHQQILAPLDPCEVWEHLHGLVASHEPILMCFERDETGCHRRMVARWLKEALGVKIEEIAR